MKRVEITFTKHQKELEKLNARLERQEKSFQKKLANAVKLGVDKWTKEDHIAFMENAEKVNTIFLANKEDIKKNSAWYDLMSAESDVEDTKKAIERAEKRLEKSENEVQKYYTELETIADLKAKEEFAKKQFEEEQKEWAKDDITLEGRYYGVTPNGKQFDIRGNRGFTNRSWHCFSLWIDGTCIFTSGEFWRAYSVIKNS